ncbi:2-keto-4-pentenoate hydratase/2-oxohepta-3-ene-1,7-dioic acid hydratase in catechol pathway [Halarchaeum rubridurum]|uniref:2-hydroxyhepta-2,4-diene-1,7-dioate isomerase n=1 Tax=Halarchaeum rubridurum TaxID=489911 RepID=A0A830FVK2_9EURY|nr:fumarylacetoacetate hydrolase family protein [Halarchaeum rubridurum]MBP1953247.1 2-keto-4-pentenoate hydratase/2-oxohepta-3-ene-1,7-dioic acid hydratase in catechol pathway [Halarchaeum rubridurum]GGM66765.1 2-hydroxyhepta-2,4-diene-1,7-dioate isomerase [Halarchaeum rubridurum]
MRHVRFRDEAGAVREGEYHDDGTVSFGGRTHALDDVEVLPPCEPSKVVCVGRNYAKHAAERNEDVPDRPLLFLKPPNAVAGHGDTVTLPREREHIEHEVEFAVVIGEQCRNVAEADAMDVVAGYTIADDVSNRDDQSREQNWVRGKAFDGACPLGPVLADPEHVDPDGASLELRVNGEVRQSSNTEHFIFDVPTLIAEITRYMTLEEGDVILTGTPEGVGPLEAGDHVEAEVEGVGTLEHDVRRD